MQMAVKPHLLANRQSGWLGMPRGFYPNKKELLHPASHDEASANPHANKHTRKDLISVRDECSLTACLLFFPWQGGDLFEAESGEYPE